MALLTLFLGGENMFSERITRLRKEKGLRQKDLANELGVSIDSVRRWEQGKRSPDVEILNNLARVLDTTVSYISGETDNPERPHNDNEGTLPQLIKEKIDRDMSFIKKGDFIGNGRVLFYNGDDGKQFVIPATEQNQAWFREIMGNAIAGHAVAHT